MSGRQNGHYKWGFLSMLQMVRNIFVLRVTFVRFLHAITLLRYADKRIVNIMKVYIERNNWQLELQSNLVITRSSGGIFWDRGISEVRYRFCRQVFFWVFLVC